MEKKIIFGMAGIAAIVAATIVTVSSVNANSSSEMSDLMTKNLEALTQNENNGGEIPGQFLDCTDGGVTTVTIPQSGSVSILGVTISGTKGKTYMITWERWECEAGGAGCDSSKAGVKTSVTSL